MEDVSELYESQNSLSLADSDFTSTSTPAYMVLDIRSKHLKANSTPVEIET